jgi:hypothetical protein
VVLAEDVEVEKDAELEGDSASICKMKSLAFSRAWWVVSSSATDSWTRTESWEAFPTPVDKELASDAQPVDSAGSMVSSL